MSDALELMTASEMPGRDAGPSFAASPEDRLRRLEAQLVAGAQQSRILDTTLRRLWSAEPTNPLPRQLTRRAHALLEYGHELLGQLRRLAEEREQWPAPLGCHFDETVSMAETALRMVQAFPDAPSMQLRLCEGLEAFLRIVAERILQLREWSTTRRRHQTQLETLSEILLALHLGEPVAHATVVRLATEIYGEAQQGAPLRFLATAPDAVERFVACHSLTTAQVMARVVRYDPQLRSAPIEPVVAALLYDVGMLEVPVPILALTRPLEDHERRLVEAHAARGAERLRSWFAADWLIAAARGHHERMDGSGYPSGQRHPPALTRLLAVCDVYAALATARPHRPALDSRSALAETLVLAEQGKLDRACAERLLPLSFYPVGSVVELSDGAVGVVVATHSGRQDWSLHTRPVVALLAGADGQPLPVPQALDLAQIDGRGIIRTLPPAERAGVLASRMPHWLAD